VIFNELEGGLLEKITAKGEKLFGQLELLQKKYSDKITEVRGKGLMIGVQLKFPGEPLVNKMIEEGVLVNCCNENVIRLLPPYILSDSDADLFIEKFDKVLGSY
jgi:acetylornithine/succinyldiaminopimelate/putrescine aminotransferase